MNRSGCEHKKKAPPCQIGRHGVASREQPLLNERPAKRATVLEPRVRHGPKIGVVHQLGKEGFPNPALRPDRNRDFAPVAEIARHDQLTAASFLEQCFESIVIRKMPPGDIVRSADRQPPQGESCGFGVKVQRTLHPQAVQVHSQIFDRHRSLLLQRTVRATVIFITKRQLVNFFLLKLLSIFFHCHFRLPAEFFFPTRGVNN